MSSIVETLQGKVEQAALSLAGMEETRRGLEEQVEAREEEIARLGKQIGSDSNLDKVYCNIYEKGWHNTGSIRKGGKILRPDEAGST